MLNVPELKIAFLSSPRFDDSASGIRGAILVTDADTKPLEFRITEPIRPTNFQRTLYGELLDEYILVEIIGIPLINSLRETADIVIVQDPLFLGINVKHDTPVVRILKDDEPQHVKNTIAEPVEDGISFFRFECLKQLESEFKNIRPKLSPVFTNRDLFEPFNRLKIACEQVNSNSRA